MFYDGEDARWHCPTDECEITARHRDDVQVKSDEPKVYKGAMSLTISTDQYGEDTYELTIVQRREQITVDVSDYVEMVVDVQLDSATLCLMLNNVTRKRHIV